MALKMSRLSGTVGPGRRTTVHIVVADGYHPDQFAVAEGVPLRLVFRRDEDHPCSDKVVFSAPRLERRLAPMATTIVDLPPHWGTDIRFTCGMGRYRGRIELVPAAGSSTPGARRSLALVAGTTLLAGPASVVLMAGGNPVIGTIVAVAAAIIAAVVVALLGRRHAASSRAGSANTTAVSALTATDWVGTDLLSAAAGGTPSAISPDTCPSIQPSSR
jgi:hypothetical protein